MITFTMKHPRATGEMLGFIPSFLFDTDPRPARDQLHERYSHGGGWFPMPKDTFTMLPNGNLRSKYSYDPDTVLLAEAKLREETIRVYDHEWVAVIQPDGTFEVSRMD
jgi:hypothetical protein